MKLMTVSGELLEETEAVGAQDFTQPTAVYRIAVTDAMLKKVVSGAGMEPLGEETMAALQMCIRDRDRLLQYVSAVLQPRLRTGDLMFRLSGDEFVLILSGEDKNSAVRRIVQAQKAMADQREQNGIFYELSLIHL